MVVRFLVDPDTDLLRIEAHHVEPQEVSELLRGPADSGPGRDGTRVLEGQTANGRYLRVIYRENESESSMLAITAYDQGGNAKAAFRRRRRRRP